MNPFSKTSKFNIVLNSPVTKDAQCSETDFRVREFFCAISRFSYVGEVDFVFNSEPRTSMRFLRT